jgi:hypothetical protein
MSEEQKIRLRRFDPSQMKDESVVVIIGKRNTGKSVLTKDLMFHKRKIPAGIVMSPTEVGNKFYGTWIPESFIYPNFDRKTIWCLLNSQEALLRKNKPIDNLFMILDDCMYDKSFMKEDCMRFAIMNGRHFKVFLVMTAQYCGDLPPAIRTNIDYVFVLRNNIMSEREKLWKNFFGVMPSLRSFCQLMDATTENHECLVIDNTSSSNDYEKCLYWYKAEPGRIPDQFRMGSPAFWRFHNNKFNPRHDEGNNDLSKRSASAKGQKMKITKLK